MTPERHQEIVDLFHMAVALNPDARTAFLSEICNGDDDLRHAVEDMLAADESSTLFFERNPEDLAASALRAHGDETLIGRTLGEYQVISRLGAGGMGDVFLAKDLQLHRNAALKFFVARVRFRRPTIKTF